MENLKKLKLDFTINGQPFSTEEQYITGAKLKELGKTPAGEPLFLIIAAPWENELILDDTRVDLARPGIEAFISKEKHPETIILTIETPKGKWENVAFAATTTVQEVIQKVVAKFGFAVDGNYKLKIKGQSDFLEPGRTLGSYHLHDHTILSFTDLGKGA